MANQLLSAIKGVAQVIGETYRLGFRTWMVAPLLVAIAVVPEFLQHVVEIRLGMFDSLDRFQALGNSPSRWVFGYAKVAGLIVSMLAIARFWATGSVRKTFAIPLPDLGRLVLAIAVTYAVSLPFDWLTARNLPAAAVVIVKVVSALLQAGLSVWVAAALFGDRSVTLRTAFTERWPTALVLVVVVFAAFMPAQMLHMFDHKLAIGRSSGVVWALMAWDSLVVGMIAALMGSALWASYRSGATWRGWAPGFAPEGHDTAGIDAVVETPPAEVTREVAPPPPPPAPIAPIQPAPTPDDEVAAAARPRRPRPGPRRRG